MGETEILLAIDPRVTGLVFLGLLAVIGFGGAILLGKSVYDQRRYSKAALPSLDVKPEDDSMVREPAESAFTLDDLDEELSYAGADDNGTNLDQLPGVDLKTRFTPEPETFEPEENALPLLAPSPAPEVGEPADAAEVVVEEDSLPTEEAAEAAVAAEETVEAPANKPADGTPSFKMLRPGFLKSSPDRSGMDEDSARELDEDEAAQDFTPITLTDESDAAFSTSDDAIDKMEVAENADSDSQEVPASPQDSEPEAEVEAGPAPISITPLPEATEAPEAEAPYVSKHRLDVADDPELTVTKEES